MGKPHFERNHTSISNDPSEILSSFLAADQLKELVKPQNQKLSDIQKRLSKEHVFKSRNMGSYEENEPPKRGMHQSSTSIVTTSVSKKTNSKKSKNMSSDVRNQTKKTSINNRKPNFASKSPSKR